LSTLVVIYYLGASEIWSDKRGSLWREEPYKEGDFCTLSKH